MKGMFPQGLRSFEHAMASDVVFMIQRSKPSGEPGTLYISKNRFGGSGMTNPCGEVSLESMGGITHPKANKPKHPNRVKNHPKVKDLEAHLFDHLKKGHLYKLSFDLDPWALSTGAGAQYLQKKPFMGAEYRINTLETGKMVMYLDTVHEGHGTFHKIVYGDQVGFIRHTSSTRFRRITKRMMEREEQRMAALAAESNDKEG
jgi:hypothetical protein